MSTYSWKITDPSTLKAIKNAPNMKSWKSPAFSAVGFRWFLTTNPNGQNTQEKGFVKLFLNLFGLPPSVKQVHVAYTLCLEEANSQYIWNATFHKNKKIWGWPEKQLKLDSIQNCDSLTFTVTIEIGSVYDNNDKDITNQYINMYESKQPSNNSNLIEAKLDSLTKRVDSILNSVQQLEQRMNDIELKMNEEQKNNNSNQMNKLVDQVQSMQKTIDKLSNNNSINKQQHELKQWLEMECKLPQYYDVFIDNGVEDLSVVRLLTMDTIKGMDIDKIGHQMKILNEVMKLNQNKEGATGYM